VSHKFSADIQNQVRQRADFLCEYCHTNERWQYVRFTIDHVLPNNDDSLENLALACFHCNRRKSNKINVLDTEINEIISIFNPRLHIWKEHFEWSEDKIHILPKTAIGRVTIQLLELNRSRILLIREADVAINRHPPTEDLS
jgi:5-methylcytosine-specific restriction endonuclease McrA